MKYFIVVLSLLLLSGCATTQQGQRQSEIKRITPEELESLIPSPIATYTLEELVVDTQQGMGADAIIKKIKDSESRYDLTTAQMLALSQQGVDTQVLDYIQESNQLAKQNAIADEMNRREKEKAVLEKQLRREQLIRGRYYDPFWQPRYRFFYGTPMPIGPAGRHWRRRFGWGLSYGSPFWW